MKITFMPSSAKAHDSVELFNSYGRSAVIDGVEIPANGTGLFKAEADKKVIEFTAGCDGYLTHKIENGDYFNAGSIIGYIKSRK